MIHDGDSLRELSDREDNGLLKTSIPGLANIQSESHMKELDSPYSVKIPVNSLLSSIDEDENTAYEEFADDLLEVAETKTKEEGK